MEPYFEETNTAKAPDRRKQTYFLAALLFAAVIVYSLFARGGYPTPRFAFEGDTAFVLKDSAAAETRVPLADIRSLSYTADWDAGQPAGGRTVAHIREGLWENASVGRYIASMDERIAPCFVVVTDSATYAVNYESADTTRAIYEALAARAENMAAAENGAI